MRGELGAGCPFWRRNGKPTPSRAVGKHRQADDDNSDADPDGPPVFLLPQVGPTGGGLLYWLACDPDIDLAHRIPLLAGTRGMNERIACGTHLARFRRSLKK